MSSLSSSKYWRPIEVSQLTGTQILCDGSFNVKLLTIMIKEQRGDNRSDVLMESKRLTVAQLFVNVLLYVIVRTITHNYKTIYHDTFAFNTIYHDTFAFHSIIAS